MHRTDYNYRHRLILKPARPISCDSLSTGTRIDSVTGPFGFTVRGSAIVSAIISNRFLWATDAFDRASCLKLNYYQNISHLRNIE